MKIENHVKFRPTTEEVVRIDAVFCLLLAAHFNTMQMIATAITITKMTLTIPTTSSMPLDPGQILIIYLRMVLYINVWYFN